MSDNIIFSSHPAADLQSFLNSRKYTKILVLTDENTTKHCFPLIRDVLPEHKIISVISGEESKNLNTSQIIWEAMTALQMDRHSILIVLGGGVLGDMGGFCAATFKRGIDFVLIPTTLLSQVDASIGGKLGIDFHNFKNHIGVFQTPALTILYSDFLRTLPEKEVLSGFAEIIKHSLISDRALWNQIKSKSITEQPWDMLIRHSVDFKSRVVREDPKENGLRKILNAGHTIGHAIETYLLASDRKIMHGEAVAAGLIAEAFIAKQRNILHPVDFEEITIYIVSVFGKLGLAENDDEPIALLTLQDKKNKGNRILCVLLESIGTARFDCEISVEEVKQALLFYRSLQM